MSCVTCPVDFVSCGLCPCSGWIVRGLSLWTNGRALRVSRAPRSRHSGAGATWLPEREGRRLRPEPSLCAAPSLRDRVCVLAGHWCGGAQFSGSSSSRQLDSRDGHSSASWGASPPCRSVSCGTRPQRLVYTAFFCSLLDMLATTSFLVQLGLYSTSNDDSWLCGYQLFVPYALAAESLAILLILALRIANKCINSRYATGTGSSLCQPPFELTSMVCNDP